MPVTATRAAVALASELVTNAIEGQARHLRMSVTWQADSTLRLTAVEVLPAASGTVSPMTALVLDALADLWHARATTHGRRVDVAIRPRRADEPFSGS
ncbi:MAG TPA: hypothetical protein VGN37_31120 [Actinocatenispora sp.]